MTSFSMQQTADSLEKQLQDRQTLHLKVDWAGELLYPDYAGLSLRNIPHTIAEAFGMSLPQSAPLNPAVWGGESPIGRVDRVVGLLTDGLGYLLLQEMAAEDTELRDILAELSGGRGPLPLTSVTPSTTAVALPALWSGASPAATGMVGTVFFLRQFATMANMLTYSPALGDSREGQFESWGMSARDFIPVRGLAETLADSGVPTHLLLQYSFFGTGLSRVLHRGIQHRHPHSGLGDCWQRLEDVLLQTRGQRCYVAAYLPNVDALSHLYGAKSRYVRAEIKSQMRSLRDVLKSAAVRDGRTLFMLMADHGHADGPKVIDLARDPAAAPIFEAMRMTPGGDYRIAYLYLREGTKQQVIDVVEKHYADRLAWVDSAEALSAGLFGTEAQSPEIQHRIGDLILIPRPGWRIVDSSIEVIEMVSLHAGLSAEEMLTPLLWQVI